MLSKKLIISLILIGSCLACSSQVEEALCYIKPTEDTPCPKQPCYTLKQVFNATGIIHCGPRLADKRITLALLQGVHYFPAIQVVSINYNHIYIYIIYWS